MIPRIDSCGKSVEQDLSPRSSGTSEDSLLQRLEVVFARNLDEYQAPPRILSRPANVSNPSSLVNSPPHYAALRQVEASRCLELIQPQKGPLQESSSRSGFAPSEERQPPVTPRASLPLSLNLSVGTLQSTSAAASTAVKEKQPLKWGYLAPVVTETEGQADRIPLYGPPGMCHQVSALPQKPAEERLRLNLTALLDESLGPPSVRNPLGSGRDRHPRSHQMLQRARSERSLPLSARENTKATEPLSLERESALSLISSRLSARRNYLPEQPEESFKLSDYPKISGGKFDRSLKKHLKIIWEAANKPAISSREIEALILRVCHQEIDSLFVRKKDVLSSALQITESPRARQLLTFIQKGGIPLIPLVQRLLILKKGVEGYVKLRHGASDRTCLLHHCLEGLTQYENFPVVELGLSRGKDLLPFLKTAEDVLGNKEYRKIRPIVQRAFGEDSKTVKEVLATLRKWADPPPDLFEQVKRNVHSMSWDNIAKANIPYVIHDWLEDPLSSNPIRQISTYEVVRCFKMPHMVPNLDHLIINGQKFDGSCLDDHDFYYRLIERMCRAGLDEAATRDEIESQVKGLLAQGTVPEADAAVDSGAREITALKVMRLATMSCWGHGDECFRSLFPGLFKAPYWTKLVQGIECRIKVAHPGKFSVALRKAYCVYRRIHPVDPDSTLVDPSLPLIKIPVEWKVRPYDSSWKGSLRVMKEPKVYARVDPSEKWKLLHALINFEEFEGSAHRRLKRQINLVSRTTPTESIVRELRDP